MINNINNFNKKKIKNLILDKGYSSKGNNILIQHGPEGGDVNISLINEIRRCVKKEEIMPYISFFSNFAQTLNIEEKDSVRWDKLLDRKNNIKYLEYLRSELFQSLCLLTSYYDDVYPIRKT